MHRISSFRSLYYCDSAGGRNFTWSHPKAEVYGTEKPQNTKITQTPEDEDMFSVINVINRSIYIPTVNFPPTALGGSSTLPFDLAYPDSNTTNQFVINVVHELYTTKWKLRW